MKDKLRKIKKEKLKGALLKIKAMRNLGRRAKGFFIIFEIF